MKYIEVIEENDEVVLKSNMNKKQGEDEHIMFALLGAESVTLIGDWHNRYLDFIEVLSIIKEYELKVRICTEVSFEEFKLGLGVASHNKVRGTTIEPESLPEHDKPMMVIMGAMMLDTYLHYTDYYVESIEDGEIVVNKIKLSKEEED